MTQAVVPDVAGSVGLAAVAVVLLYTVLRYRGHVLHGAAVELLVLAALVFAATLLLDGLRLSPLAREGLQFLASLLYLGATWRLAQSFLHFEPDEGEPTDQPDIPLTAEGGGFEDVE